MTILFLEGERKESGTAPPKSHALNAAQHWRETCRLINKRCSYTSSWTELFENPLILGSGDRRAFVRLKNREQFREARLIRFAGRAIPGWFDPFRMLLAKRVVNLVLKPNIRADFTAAARKRVHFHVRRYRYSEARGGARPADFLVPPKR